MCYNNGLREHITTLKKTSTFGTLEFVSVALNQRLQYILYLSLIQYLVLKNYAETSTDKYRNRVLALLCLYQAFVLVFTLRGSQVLISNDRSIIIDSKF